MTSAVKIQDLNCTRLLNGLVQFFKYTLLLLVFPFILTGCEKDQPLESAVTPHDFAGQVMGTWYTVKYFAPAATNNPPPLQEIDRQIDAALVQVDQLMSTYKASSEVSRFNEAKPGQWFDVSEQTFTVISLAQRISEQTSGSFDITVAPLVDLWGFGPDPRTVEVPDKQHIESLLANLGYQNLELDAEKKRIRKKAELRIDLSAIAKGFAVDQVANYLDETGIVSYMVEVGGEIRTRGYKPGQQPWRIAIESPNPLQREVDRIINVTDRAVATSGDYRNYFEKDGRRYSHTIDPKTGYPVTHRLASVTVIADTAAEADALATAFSVMGSDQAMRYAKAYNVAAYFIVKEREGFMAKLSDAFVTMGQ
jgi:thiamine biosynthesis lipoprotein